VITKFSDGRAIRIEVPGENDRRKQDVPGIRLDASRIPRMPSSIASRIIEHAFFALLGFLTSVSRLFANKVRRFVSEELLAVSRLHIAKSPNGHVVPSSLHNLPGNSNANFPKKRVSQESSPPPISSSDLIMPLMSPCLTHSTAERSQTNAVRR